MHLPLGFRTLPEQASGATRLGGTKGVCCAGIIGRERFETVRRMGGYVTYHQRIEQERMGVDHAVQGFSLTEGVAPIEEYERPSHAFGDFFAAFLSDFHKDFQNV